MSSMNMGPLTWVPQVSGISLPLAHRTETSLIPRVLDRPCVLRTGLPSLLSACFLKL